MPTNMRIVAYKDDKFSAKVSGGEYEVMLNPESIKQGRSIQYNEEQPLDSNGPSQKYAKTPGETLSFELVIDCSGVVDSSRLDLPSEMKQLSNVVYDYNGDIHRPNFVTVSWGESLVFQGVLTSFDSSYTFFKPDGTAIRAKVSLAFTSYINPQLRAKEENKKSPDMTHHIQIVDGDSLPGISQNIYGSPYHYVQLAEFNGLNKFRQLQSGSQLTVPPLVPASGQE